MSLPSIAKLANEYNIKPLKKLGQNFIYDESLCDKIVADSGLQQDEVVLEVGPGPAGLTRSILKKNPYRLYAIETDSRCMPLLNRLQEVYQNLEIIHNDAKKVAVSDVVAGDICGKKLRIISNLPYNIGTILLTQWLKESSIISSMTLMLQREVVERIVASVNTKNYGRLSVICQLICNSHKCFDVSPKAFYPPPSVWSSIVHLTPKSDRPNKNLLSKVEYITNLAFSGRRKMIKSSLKTLKFNKSNVEGVESLLERCDIDPAMRAENISPQEYLKIAVAIMN